MAERPIQLGDLAACSAAQVSSSLSQRVVRTPSPRISTVACEAGLLHDVLMGQVTRCTRCAVVIGIYEPSVVVDSTGVRHTSLAGEARRRDVGDATDHEACYLARQADSENDDGRVDWS